MRLKLIIAVLFVAGYFAVLAVLPSECIDPLCGYEPSQTGSPILTF